MLYREIIAVCSQIHTKHINTLCGQNVELLNVKLVAHIVTTGLKRPEGSQSVRMRQHTVNKCLGGLRPYFSVRAQASRTLLTEGGHLKHPCCYVTPRTRRPLASVRCNAWQEMQAV